MVLYLAQPGWAGTRTLRNINPPSLSSNSSQALPALPPSLPQGSNTRESPRKHSQPSLPVYLKGLILGRVWGYSWKKHEEARDKNPHFLYSHLILDLTKSLMNCWCPLTHAAAYPEAVLTI